MLVSSNYVVTPSTTQSRCHRYLNVVASKCFHVYFHVHHRCRVSQSGMWRSCKPTMILPSVDTTRTRCLKWAVCTIPNAGCMSLGTAWPFRPMEMAGGGCSTQAIWFFPLFYISHLLLFVYPHFWRPLTLVYHYQALDPFSKFPAPFGLRLMACYCATWKSRSSCA